MSAWLPLVLSLMTVAVPRARTEGATLSIAPGDSIVLHLGASAGGRLGFDARLHTRRFHGSAYALRVEVNGNVIGCDRLTNKPHTVVTSDKRLLDWCDGGRWRIAYSPDFDTQSGPQGPPHRMLHTQPYRFELDAAPYVEAATNRVVLRHVDRRLPEISIRDVRFTAGNAKPTLAAKAAADVPPAITTATADAPAAFELTPGAGVLVRSGALAVQLDTDVSVPRGGWRRAGAAVTGWDLRRRSAGEAVLSARDVECTRSVRRNRYAIEVHDTFVNRTHIDLGLIVRNRLRTHSPPTGVRLCGTAFAPGAGAMSIHDPQNPAVVIETQHGAVGMIPANDVAWVHAEAFYDSLGAGLADASLCIAARDSVTLAWSILIRPAGGYREWLDLARAQLRTNIAIPGPFAFGTLGMSRWSEPQLQAWIDARAAMLVAVPAPSASGSHGLHGPALLASPSAQDSLRRFAATLHRSVPGVRVLAYFHAFLVNATVKMSRYEATRLRAADHSPMAYPRTPGSTRYELVVPEPGSAFAADLERVLQLFVDLGFDGVYWDEMSYSVRPWTYGGTWDRVSGDVDPSSHVLVRRKSAVPLLVQNWQLAQIARLRRDGKVIVANTQAATHTLLGAAIPRFVETGSGTRLASSHLGVPIGLGDRVEHRDDRSVAAGIHAHLEAGVLYYYYSAAARLTHPQLTRFMYPVTPTHLREGTVWGRERILTTRSGRYGWRDASEHAVHVFDAQGEEVGGSTRTYEEGGMRWTQLDLPPGATAAVVRVTAPRE